MDIYQHFRPEEETFIDQVLDWKEQVEVLHKTIVTDFLDPREQTIFQSIIGKPSDMQLDFFGGFGHAERKQAILAPFYETIDENRFNITVLEGSYHSKFVNLSHRDVLGTLMSLGIRRKKIGDLIVDDGIFQIIADQEIAVFIQMELTKIKNTSITLKDVPFSQIVEQYHHWEEKHGTVSSTRLDVILKEIYQISRQKAQLYIEKDAVKVNYRLVKDPSYPLEPGDLISLRKKGRSKVINLLGETKKNKIRIQVARLK
ncbi:YlmH family RNA-binding protein [Tenuibacillus multivorans]|uniref:RNA-binding protein YlmH, contains S4-like domain n=1 Tax=Tenuibacillus multivorans TaxID=237069 RepID=A0A1G9Y6E8_9BACI|nr:YlmH/Sll1252 family protein [Tenuibacillus multivorans]GEL75953.1 RNA-binding protein S4 [Tenuibacillus multivorans]SDN04196.1 RNA-binding protein YlmH, contains S4-like domain [Tenuibacillus multivorans]